MFSTRFFHYIIALTFLLIGSLSSMTYTVTNTHDDGEGSLRQAIENANDHAGPDTIHFNIPEAEDGFNGSVWVIQPQSGLPSLLLQKPRRKISVILILTVLKFSLTGQMPVM